MDPIKEKQEPDSSKESDQQQTPSDEEITQVAINALGANQKQASPLEPMSSARITPPQTSQEQMSAQIREMNLTRRLSEEQKTALGIVK